MKALAKEMQEGNTAFEDRYETRHEIAATMRGKTSMKRPPAKVADAPAMEKGSNKKDAVETSAAPAAPATPPATAALATPAETAAPRVVDPWMDFPSFSCSLFAGGGGGETSDSSGDE